MSNEDYDSDSVNDILKNIFGMKIMNNKDAYYFKTNIDKDSDNEDNNYLETYINETEEKNTIAENCGRNIIFRLLYTVVMTIISSSSGPPLGEGIENFISGRASEMAAGIAWGWYGAIG